MPVKSERRRNDHTIDCRTPESDRWRVASMNVVANVVRAGRRLLSSEVFNTAKPARCERWSDRTCVSDVELL